MWFTKLTEPEKQLVRKVWEWKIRGESEVKTPNLPKKTTDSVIGKLWHIYSSYRASVGRVEAVMTDIETLQAQEDVESTESSRHDLDDSVARLKEIIDVFEWLRSKQEETSIQKI